ncbi:flavin monoamine oxidase family protein [Amycolatopsis sp. cg13]|uniref:flavin monoamine oxidase family protein n=1 Tax=Amycolatopsis sp. cg13 TaxID=3238807 RepID=UPI003524D035
MRTVVIGAGPAGLAAARSLAGQGEEVVVLEAQPYVGGRTRSDRERLLHGQPADLGGSFIDLGQDELLRTCAELGVALTPQLALLRADPDGRFSAASSLRNTTVVEGRCLPDADRDQVADEVRAALDACPPDPSELVPAWAARVGLSPLARRLFLALTGFNPVHDDSQIQMSMVEPPHVGKVCWMMADGTDALARAMSEGLDIRLRHVVHAVRRTGREITVETDHGEFTTHDVIVAVPVTPTLRIGFDPVLPAWKTEALLATPMAQGGKVIGQYADGAELFEKVDTGVMSDGPLSLVWARPVGPEDTVVLLALAADRGDGFLRGEESALAALDGIVSAVLGRPARRLAGIVKDWTREPFAGGVVSSLLGDFPRLPSLLAQSVGPVHFAGEHTADMWATGMDGALRSGKRAADQVLSRRSTAAIAAHAKSPG